MKYPIQDMNSNVENIFESFNSIIWFVCERVHTCVFVCVCVCVCVCVFVHAVWQKVENDICQTK